MLVNHPQAGIIESLESAANKEIVEPVIEDDGAGEECGREHDASREVVYPHPLRLRRHADSLPKNKTSHFQNTYNVFRGTSIMLYRNSKR